MSSASLALHDAITATLVADVPLVALTGAHRVFDFTPNPPPYPYLVLGQSSARVDDSDDKPGETHTITLQVFSRARGRAESQRILDAIKSALHDRPLPLNAHRLVNLRQEFSEARRDGDGVTFRGIVRFRAVTEPL